MKYSSTRTGALAAAIVMETHHAAVARALLRKADAWTWRIEHAAAAPLFSNLPWRWDRFMIPAGFSGCVLGAPPRLKNYALPVGQC